MEPFLPRPNSNPNNTKHVAPAVSFTERFVHHCLLLYVCDVLSYTLHLFITLFFLLNVFLQRNDFIQEPIVLTFTALMLDSEFTLTTYVFIAFTLWTCYVMVYYNTLRITALNRNDSFASIIQLSISRNSVIKFEYYVIE